MRDLYLNSAERIFTENQKTRTKISHYLCLKCYAHRESFLLYEYAKLSSVFKMLKYFRIIAWQSSGESYDNVQRQEERPRNRDHSFTNIIYRRASCHNLSHTDVVLRVEGY